MPHDLFTTAKKLSGTINKYFKHIQREHYRDNENIGQHKKQAEKIKPVWKREPEPATIAGLVLFLGFNSRQEFEEYELNGRFADQLKRGRLRIEAEYEKKTARAISSRCGIYAQKHGPE